MTSDQAPKNKGGRPPKYPGEGRRPTLSLRVRGGLYDKLKQASDLSERTISEEMERRLDQTFIVPGFDDSPTALIIRAIASSISSVEAGTGREWQEDPITASMCGDLARNVINMLLPKLPAVENKLAAATGMVPKEDRSWDTAAIAIARDEVLRQLEAVRDRRSSGLGGALQDGASAKSKATAKQPAPRPSRDGLDSLPVDVRERIEASATTLGHSPAEELRRLAEIGLVQSEALGGMSPEEYANHLAQQIAKHMEAAPNMAEIKNRSFEGEAVNFEAVIRGGTKEVAFRRRLDPDSGEPT